MELGVIVEEGEKIIQIDIAATLENLKLFLKEITSSEKEFNTKNIITLNNSMVNFCSSFLEKITTRQLLDLLRSVSAFDLPDRYRLIVLTNAIEEKIRSRVSF